MCDECQQSKVTCAFDRLCKATLLLVGNGGDAAWKNFSAFRNEALEEFYIFIINFRGIGTSKRAGFFAAEKYFAACACVFLLAFHVHYVPYVYFVSLLLRQLYRNRHLQKHRPVRHLRVSVTDSSWLKGLLPIHQRGW